MIKHQHTSSYTALSGLAIFVASDVSEGRYPSLCDNALSGLAISWLLMLARGVTPGYVITPFQG